MIVDKIYVRDKNTDNLIDITNLNLEQYQSFLNLIDKIRDKFYARISAITDIEETKSEIKKQMTVEELLECLMK